MAPSQKSGSLAPVLLCTLAALSLYAAAVDAASSRKLMQDASATTAPAVSAATNPNAFQTNAPTVGVPAPPQMCGAQNVQVSWSCPFNVQSLVDPSRRMGLWRFTVKHNCPGPSVLRSFEVATASNFNTTGANGLLNPLGVFGLGSCAGGVCQIPDLNVVYYSGPYFDPNTRQDETVSNMLVGGLPIHNGDSYTFLYQDPTKKCGQGEPQFSFQVTSATFDQ